MRLIVLLILIVSTMSCEDSRGRVGECKSIEDCDSNWTYGYEDEPLCDVPGSDYEVGTTKVCCLENIK